MTEKQVKSDEEIDKKNILTTLSKSFFKYSGKSPVYWIRGNHENHDMLDNIFGQDDGKHSIMPMSGEYFPHAGDIYLCNSGTVLELGKKKILMLGGADSIDKERRVEHKTWWRQEIPSKECQERILGTDYSDIDIVISHTAPASIVEQMPLDTQSFTSDPNYHDPTTDYLDKCFYHIKSTPNKLKLWVYGHFHMPFKTTKDDCSFIGLNTLNPWNTNPPNKDCYMVIEVQLLYLGFIA